MDPTTDAELPEGVELRDYDDYGKLRTSIFDSVKDSFTKSFPTSYGGVRVELDNVRYEGPEDFNLKQQKEAILKDKYLTRRLRGTMRMFDEETGEKLDESDMSLMRVPWLTPRNTFIHGGNEYSTIMQSRLLPGVYTRRQANGHLETQFNVRPGTGKGFRIGFEPDTAQYRMRISQANLHMYSLMKDMGVDDEDLKKRWGEDVWEANRAKYDSRVFEKAYQRLVPARERSDEATKEEKAEAIKAALNKAAVHRSVVSRNLPGLMGVKQANEQRVKWAAKEAVKTASERIMDDLPFDPDFSAEQTFYNNWDMQFEKRAAIDALPTLLAAKEHSDNKRYDRKSRLMLLLMQAKPEEFIIDQDDDQFPGVTHTPTGFKIHVPAQIIPAGVTMPARPKAVIIKGNPHYIDGNPKADAFYKELEELIKAQGYDTSFDAGEPETSPDENAALWVGHSRGQDRLQYAPEGVETLAIDQFEDGAEERRAENAKLMEEAGYKRWADWPKETRPAPPDEHYTVTDKLREAIGGFGKQASEEDTDFEPDFAPEDLRESYNALYGKVGPRLASMEEWPAEWLDDSNPMGWLDWYSQYAVGARGDTDAKQIRRWKSFKARHGAQLRKNPTPKRAFALRNWAIDPLQLIDDEQQRKELEASMAEYKARAEKKWQEKHASFDIGELQTIANFLNEEHGAAIPVGTITEPEMEQHILNFVENNGESFSPAMLEAGTTGLENVQSYMDTTSTGLPKSAPTPDE